MGSSAMGGTQNLSLLTPEQERYMKMYLSALAPMMQGKTFGAAYGGPSASSYSPVTFGSLFGGGGGGGGREPGPGGPGGPGRGEPGPTLPGEPTLPGGEPPQTIAGWPNATTPVTTPNPKNLSLNLPTSPQGTYRGPAQTSPMVNPIINPLRMLLSGGSAQPSPDLTRILMMAGGGGA
jgi:hypothetical protein